MQLPELERIISIRKRLGLTQTQLAKRAGISQSLIARVEAGTVDPRYSKVMKIFAALEESTHRYVTAKEIMTVGVVSVHAGDKLSAAINMLRDYNVSQLPVFDGNNQVGVISESVIMDQISKGANIAVISGRKVDEYMEDPLPQVSPATNITSLSSLLEHNKAVLIADKGKLEGIVTKADLLKVVRS